MKNIVNIFVFVFCWFAALQTEAQSRKELRGQKKYQSSYESKTLNGTDFPLIMPFNRWIEPAGEQVYFGDAELENHALDCSLSPDGKWLAVEGRYSVVIISTETHKIVHRFVLKSHFPSDGFMNTFSGISWRKTNESYEIYWSTSGASGKSAVVAASWNGKEIQVLKTYPFEAAENVVSALPNELLIRRESENTFLYVVLNGNNTLEKIDLYSGKTIWSVPTGVAPFGLTEASGKLFVSNWAGSVPDENDTDVAGVPWGKAKVDPATGATREGTVSVFDPISGEIISEILVGLHPNDIISSPNGKFVYVACANSDQVSVINAMNDQVSEEIPVRLLEEKNSYFGDSPNGLGITSDGKTLFVANGMDHALAVVHLGKSEAISGEKEISRIEGFIPTGAYPGAVSVLRDSLLFVANIEAEGARIPSFSESGKVSYNSHRMMASVSVISVPSNQKLQVYTEKVQKMNQLFRIALTEKLPRKNVGQVPVPLRIGEPSVFKHVVYIIKENRTYDQILGDMKSGEGDTSLCIFGNQITPNTHKLCKDFQLMDNYYASGKCSAEGHQWTDMAIVSDYVEKNVHAWFRSYPHVQEDALVYAPTGFIWDNALKHGKSVRIYGEACVPEYDKNLNWTSIYEGFKNGSPFVFQNKTTIKPVEKILSPNYPGYDNHQIPDVLRAKSFINELNAYEKMEGDQFPELIIIALPNDHTGGTRPDLPTPRAMVADNDLALGQIIEALSKSRFWRNTAVFLTEDDSQNGWDHVSAYRTVGLVMSPYSRLAKTVHTNYNQISMVRTIEQILGLPPMNISDATAMPMFDCFSATPDFRLYQSVLNQVPLDEMNKRLEELKGTALHYARKSMESQFDHIDAGDDNLFNRIIWYAMKRNDPYPRKFSGKEDDDE
ncbi:MAG: alkaline phosphatase family protein [Prolixibacteraceae bacterium]